MLERLFQEIGVPGLEDPNVYGFFFNGSNVFLQKWDGIRHGGNHLNKEIAEGELRKVVRAIENSPEAWIDDDSWAKVKQIGPYIIHLKYPPVAAENYIEIYKTGPMNIPWKEIRVVWEQRKPFIATKTGLKYGIGGPIDEISFTFPQQLKELYRVFKRNAIGWFDADAYHGTRFGTLEILKLANSDRVVVYFDDGPVEIQYLRNQHQE